jgi:hypothetical protein
MMQGNSGLNKFHVFYQDGFQGSARLPEKYNRKSPGALKAIPKQTACFINAWNLYVSSRLSEILSFVLTLEQNNRDRDRLKHWCIANNRHANFVRESGSLRCSFQFPSIYTVASQWQWLELPAICAPALMIP